MMSTRLPLLMLIATSVCLAEDQSDKQMRAWIDGLQSESYATRQWATQELKGAGPGVIDPLTERMSQFDVESTIRSLDILQSLAIQEGDVSLAAEGAVRHLARAQATASAQRANDILKTIVAGKPKRAEKILRRLGAQIDMASGTYSSSYVTITLGESWQGKIKDLTHLASLTDYREIAIKAIGASVDDQWMEAFGDIPNLVQLTLNRTQVTDRGMAAIPEMSALQHLRIHYCEITDQSLQYFDSGRTNLQSVFLFGTNLTREKFELMADKQDGLMTRFGLGGFFGIAGRTLPNDEGCLVTDVTANQAASKADIRRDDVIVEYDGVTITEFLPADQMPGNYVPPVLPQKRNDESDKPKGPSLSEMIGRNRPGEKVKVKIQRNGAHMIKTVELGWWP